MAAWPGFPSDGARLAAGGLHDALTARAGHTTGRASARADERARTSLTEVREVREQRMECWMGRGTGNVWVNRSQGEGQTEEKRGCVADDELYFP